MSGSIKIVDLLAHNTPQHDGLYTHILGLRNDVISQGEDLQTPTEAIQVLNGLYPIVGQTQVLQVDQIVQSTDYFYVIEG